MNLSSKVWIPGNYCSFILTPWRNSGEDHVTETKINGSYG